MYVFLVNATPFPEQLSSIATCRVESTKHAARAWFEAMREVARGDKPHLRASAVRKAQIRKAFVQLNGLICALRSVDFLR